MLVPAPDQLRRVGFVRVDQESTHPAFIALEVGDQNHSVALAPRHVSETMLSFEELDGLTGEWRLQHHDAVAMRNLRLRIAVIECPYPDKCGRLIGPPAHAAWAGAHAVDWNL